MKFQVNKFSSMDIQWYQSQGYLAVKDFIPRSKVALLKKQAYALAIEIQEGRRPFISMQDKNGWSFKDLQKTNL